MDVFASLGDIAANMNMQAVILSLATISIIYLFPRVTKKVPSALVALIGLTIVAILLKMDVPVIGDIPKGLPDVHIDTLLSMDWHHPMVMVIPALTLAALGAIDSLLTSVVADNKTKTKHNSNRELIGQGIGNIGAGLIGGLPGAGATMRTVVNIDAGGRTRLSGVIHGVGLLIVLLGAGAYAAMIPLPVLAGILITVGLGIIDYKGLKDIKDVPSLRSGDHADRAGAYCLCRPSAGSGGRYGLGINPLYEKDGRCGGRESPCHAYGRFKRFSS